MFATSPVRANERPPSVDENSRRCVVSSAWSTAGHSTAIRPFGDWPIVPPSKRSTTGSFDSVIGAPKFVPSYLRTSIADGVSLPSAVSWLSRNSPDVPPERTGS